jgi:nucleotide-binding universal stress UspA family protein
MPAFKRILCPVDFSETAERAVAHATAVASWSGADLTVQYVYAPMFMPVPTLPEPAARIPEGELERAREDVQRFATTAGCAAGTAYVVDVGRAVDQILARACRDKDDLIVIGTHGASGFTRLVLGSTAEKVLRKATCPVMTVPPAAHGTSVLPFRRIVCAVDFSEWSIAALDLSASIAQESGAELTVVHVLEWPWPEPPAPSFSELPAAQRSALVEFRRYTSDRASSRLDDQVRKVVAGRCPAAATVADGKPYVELLRIALEVHADLLVSGVHGRSPLDVAMFGSTANQLVRHATCPVLTVRR